MANIQCKEVNLTKRVQTSKGLRYCLVILSANGRVKPDLVLINGQPERHPEGAYYLDGVKTAGGSGCPWAKIPPMRMPGASVKNPS